MMAKRRKIGVMIKVVVVLVFAFLVIFPGTLWAAISQIDGRKCGGFPAVTQLGSETFYIQGPGVDFAKSVAVSNTRAISASIVKKWNGAENVRDFSDGKMEWGRLQIRVNATAEPPFKHYVYIKYPVGQDRFTVEVRRKASITGASPLARLTQPFSGTVDVRLTGTGLSNATVSNVNFYRDMHNPLQDSSGQELPPLQDNAANVTGQVNSSTNTDTQADVRLMFSSHLPRLTKATINITLACKPVTDRGCSGLPASFRFKLEAPLGGPNYVASHNFCVPNQTCTTTFMLNATICVTIRLDRPVPGRCLPMIDRSTGKVTPCGEIVYWTVSDRSAIQSDGATPYNPLALNNTIWIPNGQQEKRICFIGINGSREGITSKFITWKPDPNTDTFPNRRESSFTIKSK